MPFPFTCPHCGHTTNVDEQYAGQSGPCSACGKTVTIPAMQYPTTGPAPSQGGGTSTVLVSLAVAAICIVVCIGGLAALMIPAVGSARERAQRMQCTNNLKQIGIAWHNYHDSNKTFPPAFQTDADGRPAVSWRVAILPYLEQQALYDFYDHDQPWDSEHNLTVAEVPLEVFQCPDEEIQYKTVKGHRIPCANYVVITCDPNDPRRAAVGGGLINAPSGEPVIDASKFRDIIDGTSNTLMIVEVTGDDRPAWTEPVDLSIDDIANGINGRFGSPSIGSSHPGGANVCFADGSVQFIQDHVDRNTLETLATRGGGEIVDRDSLNTP